MKHILLDYDTTDEGEGCLQCFMLKRAPSFPVVATVVFVISACPVTGKSFGMPYRRGRECGTDSRLELVCHRNGTYGGN